MMNYRTLARALALTLFAGSTILAQSPASQAPAAAPSTAPDIPLLPFETFTLPNGLEVILSQDRRLPLVAVNVWYHVGPANEVPGRTGFAHLFEHMMFQGSKHVAAATRTSRCSKAVGAQRHQRHHQLRSHQLLRDRARRTSSSSRCGSRAIAWATCSTSSTRPSSRTSRTSCATSAARASRTARTACRRGRVPGALSRRATRTTPTSSARTRTSRPRSWRTCKNFFRSTTCRTTPPWRSSATSTRPQTKALVEKYFGPLQARADGAEDHGRRRRRSRPSGARSVTDRVELPRVYMAWLTPADVQARRRRGGHRGGRSSAAASRAGSTRRWCTTSRSRRACASARAR